MCLSRSIGVLWGDPGEGGASPLPCAVPEGGGMLGLGERLRSPRARELPGAFGEARAVIAASPESPAPRQPPRFP